MSLQHQQQDALRETKPLEKDRDQRRAAPRRRADPIEIGKLFEKLPPHAIEAEMSLLGSMLLDPQVIGEVVQIIRAGEDFFKPAHGAVFDAVVELYDKHSRLDLVTLHQLLLDRGVLEEIGGEDYLADLAMSVPSAAHAEYYARLVRDKAIIRQLIGIAGDIIFDAYTSPDAANEILDLSEHRIFQIAERYDNSSFSSLNELLAETLRFVQETDGPTSGLLTGFHDYDELTGGLQNGELTILAARPAMGKTALALNIAEQISSGIASHGTAAESCPVGIFSLEMGKGQLAQRLVSARAGVDVQKLRRNMINRDELPRVRDACLELGRLPMLIDDVAAITLLQIRAKARRMKAKHDIKAVFIDYLQLVSVGYRTESRQVEVSEISRGLKALARELEIPVVVMSQLNRNPENREGHRPRLSDLRESGSIEQDADVVLLLHREDYYHKDEDGYEPTNTAELIIAKQRNGPTGTIRLQWDSRTTRFHNLASFAVSRGNYE